MKINPVPIK